MAVSAPSVSELPADALQALNSFVNEARARTRVPGVAVGIIHGDRGRLLYDEVAAGPSSASSVSKMWSQCRSS